MRSLIRSLKPDRFEDLIALVSLYRPGPLGANMHNAYADRKNGRAPIESLIPPSPSGWPTRYGSSCTRSR